MDKELAGWSQPEGCNRWLYIQVGAEMRGVLQGFEWGRVPFNTLFSDVDGGIECILSKFADAEWCGWYSRRKRDLGKLKRWALVALMSFNKAKWKVLQLCQDNPRYVYKLGKEIVKSIPAEEDLGILAD